MHWWSWDDGGTLPFFGMILGPIMMIALIVVTVLIVAYLLRALGFSQRPTAEKSALDILNERFARGEIDRNEYEDRKRLLSA